MLDSLSVHPLGLGGVSHTNLRSSCEGKRQCEKTARTVFLSAPGFTGNVTFSMWNFGTAERDSASFPHERQTRTKL